MATGVPLVRPLIGEEEIEAVTRVLRTGQLASGPEVIAFEGEFATVCLSRHAVAVNSGTAAIHCALDAVEVREGDEIVTTPFTFAATATPILMQRARPKFVDIDPRTYNIDPVAAEGALSSKTKAAIVVDLFGLPVDEQVVRVFSAREVPVIEDACQAIGATRDGRPAGSLADIGCFSLYATKNLMTGEGGVLTTDNGEYAKRAKRFRQHGQGERYEYLSLGYNYRMTDIAAAIGRVQLARLGWVNERRRANAALYQAQLAGIPGVTLPYVPAGVQHAYHQFTILVDERHTPNGTSRNALRARLNDLQIGTGVYYPTPLHLNPLFSALGYGPGDFPVAERIATQVLALPIHPQLEDRQIAFVCQSIAQILGARSISV